MAGEPGETEGPGSDSQRADSEGDAVCPDSLRPAGFAETGRTRDFALSGDGWAYGLTNLDDDFEVTNDDSLCIFDVGSPGAPEKTACVDVPEPRGAYNSRGLAYDDDRVYVARANGGVFIFDVADRRDPRVVGAVEAEVLYQDIAVHGDLAFAIVAREGFDVLDVSDPTDPEIVGTYQPDLGEDGRIFPEELTVREDRVYVAAMGEGLHVVSVEDPRAPEQLATWFPEASGSDSPLVYAVEIREDQRAFVAASRSTSRLQVLDLEDPSHPELVAESAPPGGHPIEHLALDGERLVAASAGNQRPIWMIDVSDPESPAYAGTHDSEGEPTSLALDGERVLYSSGAPTESQQVGTTYGVGEMTLSCD